MARKAYRSEKITVSFDLERCIHSAECVRGLPAVFDAEKRPWIQPDRSDPDRVAEVVMRCPTGALQFERRDGGTEEPMPNENIVRPAISSVMRCIASRRSTGASLAARSFAMV